MARCIEIAGVSTYESGGGDEAVVVLHEWWGLVPHIMDVCDRFGAVGFRAFAPDLYRGEQAPEAEPDRAEWLMSRLDRDGAVDAVTALVGDLARQGYRKTAIVGFCLGSALAITASSQCDVDATVGYYGIWPRTGERSITSPLLVHVAEYEEHNWPALPAHFPRWFKGMPNVEMYMYERTQHGFFNDARPDAYDEDAAHLSWVRTLRFLQAHLAPR